jgi:RHS repeat-associated protein
VTNANNASALHLTYDGFGRVATRTDSGGYVIRYAYDAFDRVVRETFPDATTREFSWDKLDRVAVKDRQGRITAYGYDAVRNLVKVTDPLGHQTQFGYYENQKLRSLTDPKGNLTTWDIDLQNRITAKHFADGTSTVNAYEATTSRLKSMTDALGQIRQYSYALDNRLANIDYANAIRPTPSEHFSYDAFFPRLTSMSDGSGTTQYQYQSPGLLGALRLLKEDGPFPINDIITHQYDALGRLIARTIDSSVESFTYDALGRTVSHTNALGNFTLGYLGQTGQLTGQHLANGVGTDWTYEDNGKDRRLKSIANSGATRSYQYTTTPENLISQINETAASGSAFPPQNWSYGYDDASRVLKAQAASGPLALYTASHDVADNITTLQKPAGSIVSSYNNLNQATTINGLPVVYDLNGNTIDDGKRTFEWDAKNRLIGISYKAAPTKHDSFRYDGFDRRIAIVSVSGTTSAETRYMWCGKEMCQARTAANTVNRRFFNEGVYQPVGGQKLVYATDHLGSVRDMVSATTGLRTASFDYEPYGNLRRSNGTLSGFGYAGMFYHRPSGLYLTRYRAYDPNVGRWLSRDPIEELGGVNLYGYVGGNPISTVDLEGTGWKETIVGWGIGVILGLLPQPGEIPGEGKADGPGPKTDPQAQTEPKRKRVPIASGPDPKRFMLREDCSPDPEDESFWFLVTAGAAIGAGLLLAPEVTIPALGAAAL